MIISFPTRFTRRRLWTPSRRIIRPVPIWNGRPPKCNCHCDEEPTTPTGTTVTPTTGTTTPTTTPTTGTTQTPSTIGHNVCVCCPDGAPRAYTITVSGVTNNQCIVCDVYNGTFILSHVALCTWKTPDATVCDTGFEQDQEGNAWTLDLLDAFGNCGPELSAVGGALYTPAEPFDCLGDTEFVLNGGIARCVPSNPPGFRNCCDGWPSSITLSPA